MRRPSKAERARLHVLNVVLQFIDRHSLTWLTKEQLAKDLGLPEEQIQQAMAKLNLLGIVSQAHHHGPPSDLVNGLINTRRVDFDQAHEGRWEPDTYQVLRRSIR